MIHCILVCRDKAHRLSFLRISTTIRVNFVAFVLWCILLWPNSEWTKLVPPLSRANTHDAFVSHTPLRLAELTFYWVYCGRLFAVQPIKLLNNFYRAAFIKYQPQMPRREWIVVEKSIHAIISNSLADKMECRSNDIDSVMPGVKLCAL